MLRTAGVFTAWQFLAKQLASASERLERLAQKAPTQAAQGLFSRGLRTKLKPCL